MLWLRLATACLAAVVVYDLVQHTHAIRDTKMTTGPVEGFQPQAAGQLRAAPTVSTRTARPSRCCYSAAEVSNRRCPYPHVFEEIPIWRGRT